MSGPKIERAENSAIVRLYSCSGNTSRGNKPGHVYNVIIGGYPYEVGMKEGVVDAGWMPLTKAMKLYPSAVNTNSHGWCPECEVIGD